MDDRKEKRRIPIELTEYEDGTWRALYQTDMMAGSVDGVTAGEAVQELVDGFDSIERKTREIGDALARGEIKLPSVEEILLKAAKGEPICLCGQCPTDPKSDDDTDPDPSLN